MAFHEKPLIKINAAWGTPSYFEAVREAHLPAHESEMSLADLEDHAAGLEAQIIAAKVEAREDFAARKARHTATVAEYQRVLAEAEAAFAPFRTAGLRTFGPLATKTAGDLVIEGLGKLVAGLEDLRKGAPVESRPDPSGAFALDLVRAEITRRATEKAGRRAALLAELQDLGLAL